MAKKSPANAARIAFENFSKTRGATNHTRTSIALPDTTLRDAKLLAILMDVPLNTIFLIGLDLVMRRAGFAAIEGLPSGVAENLQHAAINLKARKCTCGHSE